MGARTRCVAWIAFVLSAGVAAGQEAGGGPGGAGDGADWAPVGGRIATRWAAEVSPETVLPEYPRPQMVRERWLNLNGLWEYAVVGAEGTAEAGNAAALSTAAPPRDWEERILVPFAIESSLSGVGRELEPGETLWYRCAFEVPADWAGQRVLLHFGAVDWEARVVMNGEEVGSHRGGYDAFSFDVTGALREGENELLVAVRDPTDTGGQPRGKQVREPGGIFYRRTSGIWQTVWLEPVPRDGWIEELRFVPHAAEGSVDVSVRAGEGVECEVEVRDGDRVVGRAVTEGGKARLKIEGARVWSPDDPFLYDVTVRAVRDGKVLDSVASYCALRDIAVGPDAHGVHRLLLNGSPLFQFGPLDQGFWPAGGYTAPTDEALRSDIEAVKKMGGNMLRKHVKVEPDRFYYWCDKLGMLVWQDMPSPFFRGERGPRRQPAISDEWKGEFERELAEMVRELGNHPSIVMWVPFNEGWGQNDLDWSRDVVLKVKAWDPSRLVNCASGWTDTSVGDVVDIHAYPGPATPKREQKRAAVLGEFGGLGLPVSGHTWVDESNWGYVTYGSKEDLTDAYVGLLEKLPMLIARGLSAAVYTQTTDVEIEVNGWMTYDRAEWKIDPARAAEAARALYEAPARLVTVVACAIDGEGDNGDGAVWRYTTSSPEKGWEVAGFDDSAWETGRAGFGTRGTPGAVIGTEWNGDEIWLRRTVTLSAEDVASLRSKGAEPYLVIHHDEDAEVYVNGVMAGSFTRYTTSYEFAPMTEEGAGALREGENVIAVHCRQTGGGQFVDVGVVGLGRE